MRTSAGGPRLIWAILRGPGRTIVVDLALEEQVSAL